jgi:hypothetical protein
MNYKVNGKKGVRRSNGRVAVAFGQSFHDPFHCVHTFQRNLCINHDGPNKEKLIKASFIGHQLID